MQKKLIALAIAGLSGAAFAQSNVTIYGQANAVYQSLSGTYQGSGGAYKVGSANSNTVAALNSYDSRIGFKGEEGLGNGLKAVFNFEYDITLDGATNTTSNTSSSGGNNTNTNGLGTAARQSFVGLDGGFGTLTVGRQYTPFFDTAAAVDPFGVATGNIASAARLHPVSAVARADNGFKYQYVYGGKFIFTGMIGLSERNRDGDTTAATATATTGTNTGSMSSWRFVYADGPIVAGITQIRLGDNAAGIAAGGGYNGASAALGAGNTSATAIGGTYDLKTVKLHILNDRVKVKSNVAGTGSATLADRNDWMFGVTVPMGAHTFKASYNKVDERATNSSAGAVTTQYDISNNDASQWGLGYGYALSKRTEIVANYSKISNKGNANFGLNATKSGSGTLALGAATERTTGFQVGMKHAF